MEGEINTMEMYPKKNNNRYISSELPKWAIGAHIIIIILVSLLGIGAVYLSIEIAMDNDIKNSLIILLVGIIILVVPFFLYKNLKKYMNNRATIELHEDGYMYRFHNKKTGKIKEVQLPYNQMDYVLIGKTVGYVYRTKYTSRSGVKLAGYFKTGVRFIIKGRNTDGDKVVLDYNTVGLELIDEWINVFQKKQVPLYSTELIVRKVPNIPEEIDTIPKEKYEGTLPFRIGERINDNEYEGGLFSDEYLTEQQNKQRKVELIKGHKKKNVYIFSLGVIHILLVSLLFPYFPIEDGAFSSDSDLIPGVLTIFALFFINFNHVKWYRPLVDSIFLVFCISIGTLFAIGATEEFKEAVSYYRNTVVFFFLIPRYIIMIWRWLKKLVYT